MKFFDIIILGSGASGCMACMNADSNKQIAIIDKANKLAKKLLVTGNGRCNLTNNNVLSEKYNQNIDSFLTKFNQHDTLKFFSEIGLETYFDEEGRAYPLSNSAKSVLNVIENYISSKKNVTTMLDQTILKIERKEKTFVVQTDKETYECLKLVYALGGNSHLIDNLGIEKTECYPSLVSLKTNSSKFLSGVRVSNVKVTAKINNATKSDIGEILFKDGGISGICIFNISTLFARSKTTKGKIEIDLLPNMNKNEVYNLLSKRRNINTTINNFFEGLFVSQIGYEILNRIKLDETKMCKILSDKDVQKMTDIIKCLDYDVNGLLDNNQVFSGGIALSSLDENLQCKKIKNLYFTGEACDVDGECGGFNLQWAWTSGKIVGDAL